jgi:hypothetical protein
MRPLSMQESPRQRIALTYAILGSLLFLASTAIIIYLKLASVNFDALAGNDVPFIIAWPFFFVTVMNIIAFAAMSTLTYQVEKRYTLLLTVPFLFGIFSLIFFFHEAVDLNWALNGALKYIIFLPLVLLSYGFTTFNSDFGPLLLFLLILPAATICNFILSVLLLRRAEPEARPIALLFLIFVMLGILAVVNFFLCVSMVHIGSF